MSTETDYPEVGGGGSPMSLLKTAVMNPNHNEGREPKETDISRNRKQSNNTGTQLRIKNKKKGFEHQYHSQDSSLYVETGSRSISVLCLSYYL